MDNQLTTLLEANHALSIENAAYRKWIADLVSQGTIAEDKVAASQCAIKYVQDTEELSALRKEVATIPALRAELATLRTNSARDSAENARYSKELSVLNAQLITLRTKLAELTSNADLIRAKTREEVRASALVDAQARVDMQMITLTSRIEAIVRENTELRAQIPAKDVTGKTGEASMLDYLRNAGIFSAVRDCSRIGGNLDIEVILAGKRALVEVKTYTGTVPARYVTEFENTVLVQEPDVALFASTAKIARKQGLTVEKHGPTAVIYYPEWDSGDNSLLYALYATLASSGISRPDEDYWRQLHEAYISEKQSCEKQVRALQARIGQLVKKISDLDAKVTKPELSAIGTTKRPREDEITLAIPVKHSRLSQ